MKLNKKQLIVFILIIVFAVVLTLIVYFVYQKYISEKKPIEKEKTL
jgi:Tfp pilus assembly protein PilE